MYFRVIFLLIFLTGCSTLGKTVSVSSLAGSVIGGAGGAIFSPERESRDKNAFVFGLTGAAVGAFVGYLVYERPQDQRPHNDMILDKEDEPQLSAPLLDFSPEFKDMKTNLDFKPVKKYEVPVEQLPEALKGKAKKQFVLEYVTDPKTIKVGNRTIQIDSFKAWEQIYED
jgi:hypothetical protein